MHLSGLNWGQLQLEQSSFRFNAPDNHSIINVDLCNLLGCNSSKNDITISLMDNPSQETFVLNEVRFSVPEKAEINNFTSNLQETLSKVNAMNSNDLMVAKFHHVSASAPSGIYSIEIFSNLIKLNSEKKKDAPVNIPHSNVQCMFLLPYPLGGKKYMCITLLTPIRINQTAFLHVVLLFDDSEFIDPDSPFTLEISQETISERFPSSPLNERMSGPKVEIFAKILKTMTKKKLFGQGEFRSNNGETSCISTVFRSANGFLYCLDKSLLFLHRPATFIRHEDILEIEMQGLESGNVNKNFIAIVSTKKGERFTFGSIDKRETSFVTEYLKKKNISVMMEGNSSGASVSESDDSSDEDSVEKKKRKV